MLNNLIHKTSSQAIGVLSLLLLLACCNKNDDDFSGQAITGKWKVIERNYKEGLLDQPLILKDSMICTYWFYEDERLDKIYQGDVNPFRWFYQENEPPKMVLMDQIDFRNIREYEVIEYSYDRMTLETFRERIPNDSTTYRTYRYLHFNRLN